MAVVKEKRNWVVKLRVEWVIFWLSWREARIRLPFRGRLRAAISLMGGLFLMSGGG